MKLIPLFLCALSVRGADYYVSPAGQDSNPGTQAKPFATIERARDAVREAKRKSPAKNYQVVLRGGTYRLSKTVVFSREDSAAAGRTITYSAFPGEAPVFTSGMPVTGWKKEDRWWVADLAPGISPFLTLYDAKGRLDRAKSARFTPTKDYRAVPDMDKYTLPFPAGALKNWPNLKDVEVVIRPNYGWVLNILPLESVDEKAGVARTAIPASYHMVKVRWGLRDVNTKGTAWVENTLEGLDAPGEWVIDSALRKLYLIPREGRPQGIEAPRLTELFRVEGDIDYDGPVDRPVTGLVFRGLAFTGADRFRWEKNRNGLTLQHDWEMFDRPTAMFRLRGTERVAIEQCRFYASGGGAIRVDLHGQQNRISDNVIEHIGGAGVVLAGYGPGLKDVNKSNEVLRNHIHHVGEILWHSPAVFAWQSGGNRIANNLLHDTNYTALLVSGRIFWSNDGRGDGWKTIRWNEIASTGIKELLPAVARPSWKQREPFLHGRKNIVERNEIHDVMQKLWDGDAIYVSGTGGGNVVRENFIHDCMSENMCEAIRCDDDQNETLIERNIILRTGGMGTGIAIKGVNDVLNNFIIDAVSTFLPRGIISLEGVPVEGSKIQRNIVSLSKTGINPFYAKNVIAPPDPKIGDTRTDFNLYWNSADGKWADAHLSKARAEGVEKNSLTGDPMFVDPQKGDCRFRPGSPAAKLGIQPVDLRRVGLRR